MPPLCQADTIIIDNITTKHRRLKIEIKLRRQFPGVRYALTFIKRCGLAIVLETPKEININLKQSKRDEDFFGKDLYIHLANKDVRPRLCVNNLRSTRLTLIVYKMNYQGHYSQKERQRKYLLRQYGALRGSRCRLVNSGKF